MNKTTLVFSLLVGALIPSPSAGLQPGNYNALTQAAMTVTGDANFSHLGRIVVGDVNGDRINDLILASPGADPPSRDSAGIVSIIFGRVQYPNTLALAYQNPDVKIYGSGPIQGLGAFLTVGDFNGDHIDDLAVDYEMLNKVVVFWGRSNWPSTWDLEPSASTPADATIDYGSPPNFLMTLSAGDVNGDGIADLILGHRYGDPKLGAVTQTDAGIVYVLLGRSAGWSGTIPIETTTAYDRWVITGANTGDELGYSLAVGNVDGGAFNDILVGAPLADGPLENRSDAGEVYVVPGAATDVWGITGVAGTAATTSELADPTANWPVNKFTDAQLKITGGPGQGSVYRIYSNTNNTLTIYAPFSPPIANGSTYQIRVMDMGSGDQTLTIYGTVGHRIGYGLASGDWNQDSMDDIVFQYAPYSSMSPHRVDIYFGRDFLGDHTDDASIANANVIGGDSLKSWSANRYVGCWARITGGAGAGQHRSITSNDVNTVNVSPNSWNPSPNNTSDFTVAAWDLQYAEDTPNLVVENNLDSFAIGIMTLDMADVNGDGFKDLLFGHQPVTGGASYAIFSRPQSVLAGTRTHLLANGLSEYGYDVKISNAGESTPSWGNGIVGGDLNGDGLSQEVAVVEDSFDSNRGAVYLFHDPRVPVARMTITVPGKTVTKKFIDQFRIQPNGTLGDQLSAKVESQ